MFHAACGWDRLRTFKGTRRALISRLKKSSWVEFVDSLTISDSEWNTLCEPGEWADFFSEAERNEIRNAHGFI